MKPRAPPRQIPKLNEATNRTSLSIGSDNTAEKMNIMNLFQIKEENQQ